MIFLKKAIIFGLIFILPLAAVSQTANYWQQEVNYDIDVTLSDSTRSLDGYIRMAYHNHSPDTLFFIWIHLWPNAYKNDRTAFSDQQLENGSTAFYFSEESQRGYINRYDFKINKITAAIEDHPQHQDIIKIVLPQPLVPGDSALIETPFHVKLPYNFSRGGFVGNSFQATQWYPKPAVYDRYGWHEMPYLDQGEFYSEFGEYNVNITVPPAYVVAATGVLKSADSTAFTKTLRFQQQRVHDFAWFADKDFVIKHDTLQLETHVVDVYAYFNEKNTSEWENIIPVIKSSIRTKSAWLGEYPYDVVSVVEHPGKRDGSGMEYPTITLVSGPSPSLVNHEIGHNWFYGILASNERKHPWMDEGMNSYYDNRYDALTLDTTKRSSENFLSKRLTKDFAELGLASVIKIRKDQPIETSAADFNYINYNLVAYGKTAEWLASIEKKIGQPAFDGMMQAYYEQWKFKHPYPEDFKKIVAEKAGLDTSAMNLALSSKGSIDPPVRKTIRVVPLGSLKETSKYQYIGIAPAIGYNYYDKFMAGLLIHNYSLPLSKFRFVVSPLYATGSKQVNGIGRLGYTTFPGRNGALFEVAVAGARFTADEFTDSTGKKNFQPFYKMVPMMKYQFANKNPRSQMLKYLQWKTFLISETGLNFSRDTVAQLDIISYPKKSRYVNQLQLVVANNRVLYPYEARLVGEQGRSFVRINFEGNYFFNYAHSGGLQARFFAGKFFYSGEKTFLTRFETDRYHLNMSGPEGYEDYTYSNYFIGRNEFEGLSNRQLMIRDGAFKVKSDLLSEKIGKSDDWLMAANFISSIPKKINPLEVLPIKIPLRVFVDVGTYAEAWKDRSGNGRFLYDAGFQLSLFRNVLNVYFPVMYSKQYRDYFKSTINEKIFKKNISFSIDFQNFSSRKLFPQIPL